MAGENTYSTLNALFKEVYSDMVKDLIPATTQLQREIPFTEARMHGESYVQPVTLSPSQGFTYGDPDDDAITLEDAVPVGLERAKVRGYQIIGRDFIGYNALANAPKKGKRAFFNATRYVIEDMTKSARKRVETAMLYGQSGLGDVDGSTNTNTTTTVLDFTAASWSPGIWAGAKDAKLEFWDSQPALVSSGADAVFTVASVDNANQTVTVTGTTTGITALDSAAGGANTPLKPFYKGTRTGASSYKEMAGLDTIITNTGSLFGIDASVYSLWAGNTFNAGGNLTQDIINEAVADAVAVGGLDSKVCVFVSPKTWTFLHSDQAALRRYDSSYNGDESVSGHESIKYWGQNGAIEVKPHIYVKEGEAFVLPPEHVHRVGAIDVSFGLGEGHNNENFFQESDNTTAFQIRSYTNQAVFCDRPATTVKITGITNT